MASALVSAVSPISIVTKAMPSETPNHWPIVDRLRVDEVEELAIVTFLSRAWWVWTSDAEPSGMRSFPLAIGNETLAGQFRPAQPLTGSEPQQYITDANRGQSLCWDS
jgi:hypothetical protein